jgi:hypothetical protein
MASIAAAVLLALTLAGCRQPEGSMPAPQGEQNNRIDDISRDLQNLANSDANAPAELLDDLTYLEPVPRPPARLKELADSLAVALRGTKLPDAEARQMATLVFQLVAARDMSESQIAQVGSNLRDALVKAGGQPEPAERAAAAGVTLAGEITQNKKRWYHR